MRDDDSVRAGTTGHPSSLSEVCFIQTHRSPAGGHWTVQADGHAMVSIEFVPQLAAVSVLSKTLKRHTQSARMLDVFAARFYLCTQPHSL